MHAFVLQKRVLYIPHYYLLCFVFHATDSPITHIHYTHPRRPSHIPSAQCSTGLVIAYCDCSTGGGSLRFAPVTVNAVADSRRSRTNSCSKPSLTCRPWRCCSCSSVRASAARGSHAHDTPGQQDGACLTWYIIIPTRMSHIILHLQGL